MNKIEFTNVSKSFGNTLALDNINLTVEKGKVYSLDSSININGTELNMLIVFMIWVMVTTTEDFKFMIQNGNSRLSILKSQLITYIIVSVVGSVTIIAIEGISFGVGTDSFFKMIYEISNPLKQLLWTFSLSFSVLCVTHLATLIFIRISKKQRIIVGIGLLVLFIVIPVVSGLLAGPSSTLPNIDLFMYILSFFFGISAEGLNPLSSSIALVLSAIIAVGLSYLVIKKIEIKS